MRIFHVALIILAMLPGPLFGQAGDQSFRRIYTREIVANSQDSIIVSDTVRFTRLIKVSQGVFFNDGTILTSATGSGGSADSSVFSTRYWTTTNFQAAGIYLVSSDTSATVHRGDTTWLATKGWASGQFAPLATYLVPADTNLHAKRTDTTWQATKAWASGQFQPIGIYPSYQGTPTEGKILKYTSGVWALRDDTVGSAASGISAATAAGMIHDTVTARAFLMPNDTLLNAKRTDTTWLATKAWGNGQYQAKATYLVPADSNLNAKRTDTTWLATKAWGNGQYQAKATYLVPADTNLNAKRTDTTWLARKTWAAGQYLSLAGGTTSGALTVGSGNLTVTAGNVSAQSGYLNVAGIYNSATWYRMYGSSAWMDIITRVTVGNQKMINIDSVNLINQKNIARIDSASLVIAMAGTSWLATTNTDSTSGPILFPKYFIIDSVMVALVGTASTDSIKVDVRYGPDVSSTGTAVVTTPAQIAASGLWTRTVPNSATIPAFNSVWAKVTKKTGTAKRLTVMLKGRWQ